MDLGGRLLEGLGLGDDLDLSVRSNPVELGFVDTVAIRAGFEWTPLYWLDIRTGYFFRPTPAPRATSVTAYLDNDAHVISLGAAFRFMDPFDVHPTPTTISFAAQASVLPRRTVYRDTAGDPVGDLSHGGAIYTLAIDVSHSY